ncbi:MAG: hypothetical protein ABMA64_18150 [Myxococcota bacterium]
MTFLLWFACSGDPTDGSPADSTPTVPDTDTDTETIGEGQCGSITRHDVTIRGGVRTPGGGAAIGAEVWLEERNYDITDKVYGATTTNDEGRFEFVATQVVAPENCWGTLVDYRLMATMPGAAAESLVNDSLFHAVTDGTLLVDVTNTPLVLEPTDTGP